MKGDPHGDLRVEANLNAYREAAAWCISCASCGARLVGTPSMAWCRACRKYDTKREAELAGANPVERSNRPECKPGAPAGPCTIAGCHVCTGQIRERYLKGGDSARM